MTLPLKSVSIAALTFIAIGAPGLCAAQLPMRGGTSGAITFADGRSLPPAKLADRTLRMLAPAWIKVRRPEHGGMYGPYPLTSLVFVSRASPTGFPNLCQSKLLVASFTPLSSVQGHLTSEEADRIPVRSNDMDVWLQFHSTGPYAGGPGHWTAADERRMQHACNDLDPDKAFFRAPDGSAAWAAVQMVEQLSAPTLADAQLACDSDNGRKPCHPEALASRLRIEQLSSVTDQPCMFGMILAEEQQNETERCQEMTFSTGWVANEEHLIRVRVRYQRESHDHGRMTLRQAVLSEHDLVYD